MSSNENNDNSRKASDILLDIETKIDKLFATINTQNLNHSILSNKFSTLLSKLEEMSANASKPIISAHVVNQSLNPIANNSIKINTETTIPIENNPQGFRHTSRPETYVNKKKDKLVMNETQKNIQIQTTPPQNSMLLSPSQEIKIQQNKDQAKKISSNDGPILNKIPVSQKVLAKSGANNIPKPIFMADVEVFEKNTSLSVFKNRTNANGKWQHTLPPGEYTVLVTKRESLSQDKLQNTTHFSVSSEARTPVILEDLVLQ